MDICVRALTVDVHKLIVDLAYVPVGLLILQKSRRGVHIDFHEHRVRHLADVDGVGLRLEDHLVRLFRETQLYLVRVRIGVGVGVGV